MLDADLLLPYGNNKGHKHAWHKYLVPIGNNKIRKYYGDTDYHNEL